MLYFCSAKSKRHDNFSINPARFGLDIHEALHQPSTNIREKMKKNVKKSQEATVKTKLLCMDADVVTNEKQFAVGDKIKAEVVYVDEDNLRITQVQNNRKPQTESPERKFKDLTGSLHGKISRTDFGVTLHLYVRHGDYKNARALADIFESETEQMCDVLGDMKLGEEADPCGK